MEQVYLQHRARLRQRVFLPATEQERDAYFLDLFAFQYTYNGLYRNFCDLLGKGPGNVLRRQAIPFLPISFFKTHTVQSGRWQPVLRFSSSGTGGMQTSSHLLHEETLYTDSFLHAFRQFYGDPAGYAFFFLLPSYMEREGSSLIYMCEQLRLRSPYPESGFYLHADEALLSAVETCKKKNIPILLLGVSFALLDLAESGQFDFSGCIVMETGGMKGRRTEPTRAELHEIYCRQFNVKHIHSEYGMTELLSQAYSKGEGLFEAPPWMDIQIFDTDDPFSPSAPGKTGAIHVTDGANIDTCAFIATQDLGKKYEDGRFEVLGRFDHSDVRGCSLLIAG